MFTGIIEEVGSMRQITRQGQTMILTIDGKKVLEDVHLGDSVAVNGVCLTVISFQQNVFSVDVMPETYRKSNLKNLQPGDRVNLERAMSAQGRFGGHIVQGHVDSTGIITSKVSDENAVVYTIEPEDASIFKYVIPHGSITIDGISLTVVDISDNKIKVSIIPHTLSQTILEKKRSGDIINIECDVLGKYVESILTFGSGKNEARLVKSESRLTEKFLLENGF